MKKSSTRVSRSSRASSHREKDLLLSHVLDVNWGDMLEEEETDLYILGLRDTIINDSLKICYEKYLEKQSVAFTVHCAYLAWLKVIGVYYMHKDPGDSTDADAKESWLPDEEPPTSCIDSWASNVVPVVDLRSKPKPAKHESKKPTTPVVNVQDDHIVPRDETSRSFASELGEVDYFIWPGEFGDILSDYLPKTKSIFSRTLSMSRELLPVVEPLDFVSHDCKCEQPSVKKKKIFEEDVSFPVHLDVSMLPQNRLEVKYTIVSEGEKKGDAESKRNGKK